MSTLPQLIIFYNRDKVLYLGRFVRFYAIKMEQKTERLYPSATLMGSKHELEQRLEKNLNDFRSFLNHINNIREMSIYFEDKNRK